MVMVLFKKSANIICSNSKYLAVNAQINSGNIGYHSMKKYKRCDCVIINERELRQEFRDKNKKIEILMKKLSFIQKIKNLIVTRGNEGSILLNKINFFIQMLLPKSCRQNWCRRRDAFSFACPKKRVFQRTVFIIWFSGWSPIC